MQPSTLFDPYTGQEVDAEGNVIEGGTNFSEIAPEGYELFTSGPAGIKYPGGSTFLGTQGPFQFIPTTSGHYQIISETRLGLLNVQAGTQVQRMVSGEVDALLGGTVPETFQISQTRVGPTDRQWVTYDRSDGTLGFTTVKGPFRNDAELGLQYPGMRLATGEQAAYASIMKQLIMDHKDRLREIADENGIEGDNQVTGEYLAARLIMMNLDVSRLRAFASVLVG